MKQMFSLLAPPRIALLALIWALSFFSTRLAAQIDCGTPSTHEEEPPKPEGAPCFDAAEIIEDCKIVYLRVNFHFFVADDCTGSVDVNNLGADWSQEGVFFEDNQPFGHGVAERMVYGMNQALANNQPQKLPGNVFASSAPCVPLRLVLGDVKIHCNLDARAYHSNWPSYYQDGFGQHAQPGINIYYTRIPKNTGMAQYQRPWSIISILDVKNTLHEIGHNLYLIHTFLEDDLCSDTPNEGVEWDKNCDGDALDIYDEGEGNPCNDLFSASDDWCTGVECATSTSPCCDPANVYNNLMGYSNQPIAVTDCQIVRMMNTLNNNSVHIPCSVIAQIGGECPPPAAVLGIVPLEEKIDDCSFCLQGSASMNDDFHKWDIYEWYNNAWVLAHSSGWVTGKAGKYCLSPKAINRQIKANTEYKAVLTVKTSCDTENQQELVFKTPDYKCELDDVPGGGNPVPPPTPLISPNPGSGTINYTFTLASSTSVKLVANRINSLEPSKVLYDVNSQSSGTTTITFSTSTWSSGLYAMHFITGGGVVTHSFVKQ